MSQVSKKMLSVALAVVMLIVTACSAASAPPSAVITSPVSSAQFMIGQPIVIQGKVTGGALKSVDVYIDNVKNSSVSAGSATSEFTISASWIAVKDGVHIIQLKGLNDKGEIVITSDTVVVMVDAPAPTAGPTQPPAAPAPTQAAPGAAATATVAAQPTAAAQGPQASVKEGEYVNVRKGPDYTYDILGQLPKGQTAPVLGKNANATWWQIRWAAAADGVGWVIGQLTQVSGDTAAISVAAAPPAPTAAPVAQAPTSPPAPAATRAPAPTAVSQLPDYAQRPYSQKMLFTPRDNIGDIPLGVNAEPRVFVVTWEVYGATKLEMDITAPQAPELYTAQCVPGNLDNIQADSSYVAHQRFPINVPLGLIRFVIPSTGYYVMTIHVTKADGSTTSIPRAILVENCYKKY